MGNLSGKTIFITGGSRGIGKAIALKAAEQGANIAIAAKTKDPHPQLPGTVFTTAEEIESAGGKALPLVVDVRYEEQVASAVKQTAERFGGIDILINNASAISLTPTAMTEMKRFDLMHSVNVRATFLSSKLCLPFLKKSVNPHILNLAPPLNMDAKWFAPFCAYTMSKYGMSMCTLGMAAEFKKDGIAVNALWPKTVIDTAAVRMLGGAVTKESCRKPEIVADAAVAILSRKSTDCSGKFLIDEEVLKEHGVTDFDVYAVTPGSPLAPDIFL